VRPQRALFRINPIIIRRPRLPNKRQARYFAPPNQFRQNAMPRLGKKWHDDAVDEY